MERGFHTIHFSPMFGGDAPVLDVIRLTADAGFDTIGIDLASIEAHVAAGGSVGEVAATITEVGLRCSDVLVLTPGIDDDLRGTARTLGALASALGSPACIAAVAGPVPRDDLVTSLRDCASILAEHDCRLAIEFTPYSELRSLREAKALCAELGWDRAGLVLDALHFFRSGAPWEELSSLSAEQIQVVQWDDAPAGPPASLVDESRHGRMLPGSGRLPLRDLAGAVRATGWDGVVGVEVLSAPFRSADPRVAIPAAFEAMTGPRSGWG